MPKKTIEKKSKVGDVSKSRMKKEQKKQSNAGVKIAIFFISMVVIGLSIGILFSPAFNLTKVGSCWYTSRVKRLILKVRFYGKRIEENP